MRRFSSFVLLSAKTNMKKAKIIQEVPQRATRSSSKIIGTLQGGIIDFSKFKAEPKKTLRSSSRNQTKEENDHLKMDAATEEVQKTKKSLPDQISKTFSPSSESGDLNVETKSNKPRKPPNLKRKHVKIGMQNLAVKNEEPSKIPAPLHWQLVINNLREMRKNWDAPVDSMGCHKCTDESATSKDKRYQNLLGLMLSSQTKDQVTHAAMQRLIEHGCTVDKILATSDEDLGNLIYPVSFWKNKVGYIKKTTAMLKEKYDGDIPHTVDELQKLAGVGPKMAHLCMQSAWDEVTGIGVDVHVHRISNRLGWVNSKTPEQTRVALESWLPKEHWAEINRLMVGFGQTTCSAEKPKCGSCMNSTVCPSAGELM